MSTTFWLAALCLVVAVPARAQVQPTFDSLPDKVRKGQTVIVVDEGGAQTRGVVEDVSSTKLVVNYGREVVSPSLPTTRTFTPVEVNKVLKPGHLWDGAIKGAVIGALPGIIFGLGDECDDCGLAAFTVTWAAIGAGIGVGIDALWGPKTVFRKGQHASRVSLVPIVGRERKGVAAAVRF